MTELRAYSFAPVDLDTLAGATGRVAVLIPEDGTLSRGAECLNGLTGGALARVIADDAWAKKKSGDVVTLAFPAGMAAEAVDIVRLAGDPSVIDARNSGAKLAKAAGKSALTVLCENGAHPAEFAMGLALRGYDFAVRKSAEVEPLGAALIMCDNPEQANKAAVATRAVAEGIVFTRDLVSEPANVLTTTEFADRLVALTDLGVEVEVLEEDELAKLGMGALLGVGMGSAMPSKVVIMRWNGGTGAPLALVGKGVVFDTGGISLKPAPGMEDMTMDMGGAGVVSGVMKTLALRKAKANVVGLVGLVENMPSSTAQRPGDIVTSMKGDTIEVLNTDAEGRLVLADVMWHAQISENPRAMIDLATLTGAVIIALGHDHAGVFSNNTGFANDFLTAAKTEGEGAWQLPLAQVYDDLLKSAKADIKNIGGRAAGSITAAQFLQRFVKDDLPWIHLDIAGVAQDTKETALAPKGATGWGVLALDRLVRNTLESDAE